jgi:predicted metal-dependent HD superfamily phosphohydrolase
VVGTYSVGHVGTRLLVRQVIGTLHGSLDTADAADTLGIPMSLVQAAAAYYAQFGAEVDADMAWAEDIAEKEYAN